MPGDGTFYTEHRGDLVDLQKERDRAEAEILRQAKRFPRAQRAKILEKNRLLPGGKREVELSWGETKRVLGRDARRLLVTENGRTIIDCFIAQDSGVPGFDIAGGRSFFGIYRRLGAFSEDVLEVLEPVRGLPLAGTITVVVKFGAHKFHFDVQSIEPTQVAPSFFDLPPGAELKVEVPEIVACEEKACENKTESAKAVVFLRSGVKHHFCSDECKKKYAARVAAETFGKK